MSTHQGLLKLIIISVFTFVGLSFVPKASAQTCAPTRIVNQWACVSSPSVCSAYENRCQFASHSCSPGNSASCGPGEGTCGPVCIAMNPQGPPYCSGTGSQTVGCSGPPSCQFSGGIVTCSGGGSTNSSCTENVQNLTYGCWVNGSSGGSSGPGGGGYGACGGCSGCPGTNQTQCRTDPGGSCVWDPSGCGQGNNNPPPAYMMQYFVTNYAAAQPQNSITQTTQGTNIYAVGYPVNQTCNWKIVFTNLSGTVQWTGPSGNEALSYWYYNSTSPQYWGVGVRPTSPGILIIRATGWTTCPGYPMIWSITDASILVNPPPQPPTTCIAPVPNDPPAGVCAASPTTPSVINWSWLRVPFADSYNFEIRDQNDAVVIANAAHTAASLGCSAASATTCTLPVSLLPGTYHSLVSAHSTTGACTPDSAVGRSQDYQLNTCSSNVTMTLEQEPSVTGGTVATQTGSGSTAQCTSPSSGAAYNGGGAIKAQAISNGATYVGSVSGSTATINNVPNVANNYNITFTPLNNYFCTCPAGCTYNTKTIPLNPALKFYVSPVADNWFQTIGGDIASLGTSGTTVDNPIPAPFCTTSGCSPYFSLPLVSGKPETAGSLLINSGATVDLKSNAGMQSDNVGNPSRLVSLSSSPAWKENYDYFYRLFSMGVNPSNIDFTTGAQFQSNAKKPTVAPDQGRKAYYSNGNLTVDTAWSVNANEKIVVFVNGNLIINKDIKLAKGGFVGFIVKGNITITPSVGTATFTQTTDGQVQGMYLADGTLKVDSVLSTGTELKFIGEGTFAAKGGISLPRDFRFGNNGSWNNSGPASLFIFRPDLIKNAPDDMKTPTFIWKETSP